MARHPHAVTDAATPRADQHLIDLLRLGGRATSQRLAVLARLAQASRHLTAIELHRDAIADGELIELSTVHRTLTALADSHVVHCVYTPSGAAFGFNEHTHAHATCHACGTTVDLDCAAAPDLTDALARTGYTDTDMTVTVISTCPACA